MSDQPRLYIAGIGMITPVGFDAPSTAAAVKAGISAYAESDFYDDEFNKIKLATVPEAILDDCLNEELLRGELDSRQARMLQLSKSAIEEIKPKMPKNGKIPLILSVPEQDENTDCKLEKTFIENLVLQSDINIDLNASRIVSNGRSGGLVAIKLAFRVLESTGVQFVLVGGIDTFFDKNKLDILASSGRLLTNEAVDGFVPGEAAAFILLTTNSSHMGMQNLPSLFEPGLGEEEGHIYSETNYTGDGLSDAVRTAISLACVSGIKKIYTSMNGEHFWAKEYGVAVSRNRQAFDEDVKHEHPAEFYGDAGAATGVILVGLAVVDMRLYNYRAPCLICCSSDRVFRSAIITMAE